MDAQELRNLQEAYMEVVENQLSDIGRKVKKSIHSASWGLSQAKPKEVASRTKSYSDKELDTISRKGDEPKPGKGRSKSAREFQLKVIEREKRRRERTNEQVDIYDIILSHLLDEGYAETEKTAVAIMANMSEEWRDQILEELELDEKYKPEGRDKLIKKMGSLGKPDPDSTQKQNQVRADRAKKMYDKHHTSYVRPKSLPGGFGGPEWKSRKNKEKAN